VLKTPSDGFGTAIVIPVAKGGCGVSVEASRRSPRPFGAILPWRRCDAKCAGRISARKKREKGVYGRPRLVGIKAKRVDAQVLSSLAVGSLFLKDPIIVANSRSRVRVGPGTMPNLLLPEALAPSSAWSARL
jgi:hypothetical protein